MAWNTPNDKKSDQKDPWTGQSKDEKTPPLLEDLIKNIFRRLKGNKNSETPQKPLPKNSLRATGFVLIILLFVVAGFYRVGSNQEAMLFRFGQYQKTLDSGWHWRVIGVDRVVRTDRDAFTTEPAGTNIISQDKNLAHIEINISYRINDPKTYYTKFNHPKQTLQAFGNMALQQTAANMPLSAALSDDKNSPFVQALQKNLAALLDQTPLGVQLNQVEITNVAVPSSVQEDLDKINALYAEQNKQKQKAEDYEKEVLPPAEVKATKLVSDAEAYSAQAKIKAQEEVAGFMATLPAYKQAPAVTRYRLYSQVMKNILLKTTKVVVSGKDAKANIYVGSGGYGNDAAQSTPQDNTPANTNDDSNNSASDNNDDSYGNVKGGYA